MSLGYRWMIDEEPYTLLRSLKPSKRRPLERAIAQLAAHPFTEPHFIGFDSDDQPLFHLFVGSHTIIYHVDHAVRRILILQIALNP